MNDHRKRLDQLVAAQTERELTRWEREELWQILDDHPEWIADYVAQLQLPAQLAALDAAELADAGIEAPADNLVPLRPQAAPPARPARRRTLAAGIAALLVAAAGTAAWLLTRDPGPTPLAAGPDAVAAPTAEDPLADYERRVSRLPVGGSESRPPTGFASSKDGAGPDFADKVQPILSENCWSCHGPGDQKADLRLDSFEHATADLGGYAAIVPGKADESEMIARIFSSDEDEVMPPPDSHKSLSPEQKEVLRRWIDAGAEFEAHWAFTAPSRTQPPVSEASEDWARQPLDHFVHARLAAAGLEPNPEAGKRELARRAALDVTGLPADPAAVDRFVADPAPDAFERYLDALFASPHYGEHRARFWLDAARYGDTHGMHLDNYREMWPYRDWVIAAFNRNQPFDEFAIEQLAGDLLPEPTQDQLVATGFNRNHITTSEDGSIPEELRVRYMTDRVETTSTVFLGLTTACAACHDHKFDPISQKEFYQLGAFFNNTADPAMDGNEKATPPVVVLPDEQFSTRWQHNQERRRQLGTQLAERRRALADSPQFADWREHREPNAAPVDPAALALAAPLGETTGPAAIATPEGSRQLELPDHVRRGAKTPAGPGIVFADKGGARLEQALELDSSEPFTVSLWVRTADEVGQREILSARASDDEKLEVLSIKLQTRGGLEAQLATAEKDRIKLNTKPAFSLAPSAWQHIAIRYSGGQDAFSFDFFLDGDRDTGTNGSSKKLEGRFDGLVDLILGPHAETCGISHLRVFNRHLADEEIRLLAAEPTLRDGGEERSELLLTHFAQTVDTRYRALSRELEATETERDFIAARSATTLVMQERDTAPIAHVLARGEYDQRGERVGPAVPAALTPLPEGAPANRLGLARWIVDPDHPLTARVTVNRLWQSLFGTGLVKTAEDFGIMGEQPSHPQLLDWLAVEFIESGWDVKHLLRLVMTSATYRQSGRVADTKLAADPENRLLSRGPRIRLDAEVLRDQALAASGLLVPEIGGPSVKPYQPKGLWRAVAFGGSNTKEFKQDSGDDLYRRSVYTFWKRTSPPPSMAAFDAPTREGCTVRRERTNTPLQALVLLNDPQFVEAARHLAEITLSRSAGVPPVSAFKQRLDFMHQRLLARPADAEEVEILRSARDRFRARFESEPEAATELIATGDSAPDPDLEPAELATWTLLANLLLNRDDVINK